VSAHAPDRAVVSHRRLALLVLAIALGLDGCAGVWYAAVQHIPDTSGWAYALGVATTSGSAVPAGSSPQAKLVTAIIQLTILPLFGAAFSLVTSGLTEIHIKRSEHRIKSHVTEQVCGPDGSGTVQGQ
jgi:hypothetical protein